MGGGKPQKGGRRPRDLEMEGDLDDPDEMEKRQKRRLRNKEAAARCRQRRLDLMNSLQDQVDQVKAENERKENEIRNMNNKLARLVDFIKTHQCKMSEEEKNNLSNILASSQQSMMGGGVGNHNPSNQYKIEPNPNDYQPQRPQQMERKRPMNPLPPSSEVTLLEPDSKLPKIDGNPMISNGLTDQYATVTRPNRIDLPVSTSRTTVPTTPSNITPFQPNYGRSDYDGGYSCVPNDSNCNMFLNTNTGLTPVGSAPMAVSYLGQTPTSLPVTEAELRSL